MTAPAKPATRTPWHGRPALSRRSLLAALAGLACGSALPPARANAGRHAIAMHGEPAFAESFAHPPYADPRAVKGGRLVLGILGTFDSLNPLIVKGLPAQSIRGYVIESLLTRGYDEPFTLYGLIARRVATDDARSHVTFTLDPSARFSDGRPVRAEDVVFSWQLLRDRGRPNHRTYYAKVTKADVAGGTVRFSFDGSGDRELPLILGLMPVLPQHAVNPERFEETTLAPLIGSGPYVIAEVDAGRSVTLRRNPDYWGRDLAIYRGSWNFDEIRFDYYRDANSHFEAFKRGLYDVRVETDPGRWQTAYDIPPVRDGRIIREEFTDRLPKGMFAFVFNTRRAIFSDIRVREALALLFDFEWVNKNYYFNLYRRTRSYYAASELASDGRPADGRERTLLAPFPGAVRADIMEGQWAPPVTDGSGRDRHTLKAALALLEQAGFALTGTELRERASGTPFGFEILVTTREHERLALAYARDLKRAGIAVRVRVVDPVQYDRRRLTYDFDMIANQWDASLSPGNEQAFYWGAAAADTEGTRNYMGVKSAAVDAMIAAMLAARDRDEFVSAVRALDRVLLSGFFVVPLFYHPAQWVARWSHIRRPQPTSLSGFLLETWWRETA